MVQNPSDQAALRVVGGGRFDERLAAQPRDLAFFPGATTRSVLARVLVGQLEEGLSRCDVDGVRRSCSLLEAIWSDVPSTTREKALTLIAEGPEGAEGLMRMAIRDGNPVLAADMPQLPALLLQDLGRLPDNVVAAICRRTDFEDAILPRLAALPESARTAVALLYPSPMPNVVRDALLDTVRQGDTALGDALLGRADRYTADLADDLAQLAPDARISRLRFAARDVVPNGAPQASPLLDKITQRLNLLSASGQEGNALFVVAQLMRVPAPVVSDLASDDDPVRLALGLRGVCLAPALADVLRQASAWPEHAARAIVEGDSGYALGRRFVADLRRRAS